MFDLNTFEELKPNNIDDIDFQLDLTCRDLSVKDRIAFDLNTYCNNMLESISECFFLPKYTFHQDISTFYSKREFVCAPPLTDSGSNLPAVQTKQTKLTKRIRGYKDKGKVHILHKVLGGSAGV